MLNGSNNVIIRNLTIGDSLVASDDPDDKDFDYEKAFAPDLKNGRDIFSMRGIDREQGCLVVVRPDQYVALVLPLDGFRALSAYFGGFLTVQS